MLLKICKHTLPMYQTMTIKITKENIIVRNIPNEGIDASKIINYKRNSHNGIST